MAHIRHWLFHTVLSRVYVYFFRLLLGFYKSLACCCAVPGVNETDGIGRCVESNMIQLLIIQATPHNRLIKGSV